MISYLQAENISKRYGEKLLFEGIDINISQNQKIALIAKNGTGKTTLLNILGGLDTPDSGALSSKRDLKISYLPQDINLDPQKSIIQAVFFQEDEIIQAIRNYNDSLKTADNEVMQKALDLMDSLNAWDYEAKVKQILGQLELFDYDEKIAHLSGGQKKRVALAGTLISNPDLLILDEPTNHLDLSMIEWLEEYLSTSDITLFMVTHDRYFLDRVCTVILELDQGKIFTYQGNYSYFIEKRTERIENLQANITRSQNLMKTEQEWMRRMPKARTHKAKHRVDGFDELKEKANRRIDNSKLELGVASDRLGKKVIDIYNLKKSFDDKCLINDFSYKFARGEKVGIVGKNGSGKTTFLNLLAGEVSQDKGRIDIGETVKIAYYKQDGISFDDDTKPIDVVKKIAESVKLKNGKSFSASGFLQYFLFPPDMQHNFIRKLSGGEKRRLYLCTILMQQPNVLFMDEPTNDLDIMTLQVLEEYLMLTDATVIVVSHDRFFMDKIVDHVFVFDGKGEIRDFPGNYTQYRNSDLYQTETEQAKPKAKIEKAASKKQNVDTEKPKKISFNEKYEFEQLEKELPLLDTKRQNLENELHSGNLSNEDLILKSDQLSKLLSKIEKKEHRWLELSELL
ncbi:MAG: ABC-F family ATP-binding cassette domain-containing protein [Bacteroidales bacterium]|nr:ABC-F family ATP-binding cassette domain-containing protein [Bacteroidales bacterium]